MSKFYLGRILKKVFEHKDKFKKSKEKWFIHVNQKKDRQQNEFLKLMGKIQITLPYVNMLEQSPNFNKFTKRFLSILGSYPKNKLSVV